MKKLMILGCMAALLGAGTNTFADPGFKVRRTARKSSSATSRYKNNGSSTSRVSAVQRHQDQISKKKNYAPILSNVLRQYLPRQEIASKQNYKPTTLPKSPKSKHNRLKAREYPSAEDLFTVSYTSKIESILQADPQLTQKQAAQKAVDQWVKKYQLHYTDATKLAEDLSEYYDGKGTQAVTTMLQAKQTEVILFEIPAEGITFAPDRGDGMIRLRPIKRGNASIVLKPQKCFVMYDIANEKGYVVQRDGFIISKIITKDQVLAERGKKVRAQNQKAAQADPISTYHAHQREAILNLANAERVWQSNRFPYEFSDINQLGGLMHDFHKGDPQHVHLTDASTGEVFRIYEIINANLHNSTGMHFDPHIQVLLYNVETGETKIALRSDVEAALFNDKTTPLANYKQHKEKTLAKLNEVSTFWKQNDYPVLFDTYTDLGLLLHDFHKDDPAKVKVFNTLTGKTNFVYEIVVPNLRLKAGMLFDPTIMTVLYDAQTKTADVVLRRDIEEGTLYKLVE